MKRFLLQIVIFVALLGVWFTVTKFRIYNSLLVPSPLEVGQAFGQLFTKDNVLADAGATIGRTILGLGGGIFGGLIIGLAMGISRRVSLLFIFWLDFARSIPGPALLPLFLLFFGIGDSAKIFFAIFITILIVIIGALTGMRNSNANRQLAARSLKLGRMATFFHVTLPEALPHASAGVKIALSFGLVAIMVSEMMSSTEYGLGKRIVEYNLVYETGKMYATIILSGVIGYAINKLYLIFEARKIHWAGK